MDSKLSHHLSQLLNVKESDRIHGTKLLLQILNNIISYPSDPKYRDLNLTKLHRKFDKCRPCLLLLLYSGFKPSADKKRLIYNLDNIDLLIRTKEALQAKPATVCVESIDDVQVTQSMANYILAIIHEIEQLFASNDNEPNHALNDKPKYVQIIGDRIKHFNGIKNGLHAPYKYKNVGEILKDIDTVWKIMYKLTDDQIKQNKQHDINSDFITFASGLEAEFYRSWDVFEHELVKNGYLNTKNTEESQELKDWFTNILKLPQYFHLFIENGYDDLTLILGVIKEHDLKEMGIKKEEDRRKILLIADSPDIKKRKLDNNGQQPPKKKRRIQIDLTK